MACGKGCVAPLTGKGRTVTTREPFNSALFKLHRVFYVAIGAFAVIMLSMGAASLIKGEDGAGVGFMGLVFLPVGVLHWYAAKGAREGKTYGRVLSRHRYIVAGRLSGRNGVGSLHLETDRR